MSVYKVGLTGGIASGKSTVASLLAEEGFLVFDADRLVADLYRPGRPGAEAVTRLFGREMLDAEGGVDHRRLAERVFADPEARAAVEAAVHPLVRREFEARVTGHGGVAVLEATLLVEAGYAPHFDLVVTVEADPEVRLRRAVARGLPRDEVLARLAAQGDGAERRAAADRVLRNDGDRTALAAAVGILAEEIRRRARARPGQPSAAGDRD